MNEFHIYDAVVSALDQRSALTYAPLIRSTVLFESLRYKPLIDAIALHKQRKMDGEAIELLPIQQLKLSGANEDKSPTKRDIKKIGYFAAEYVDDFFLSNIMKEFERQGARIEKLALMQQPAQAVGLSNKQEEEIDFFETGLGELFNISLRDAFNRDFKRLNSSIYSYYRILKQKNIDALILRCYYNPAFYPAIFASKLLGITVVDIQHGHNGPWHLGYSTVGVNEIKSPLFPDVFWVWSEMTAKLLSEDGVLSQYSTVVPGGHPVFTTIETTQNPAKKKKILYTHQVEVENTPFDELKKVYRLAKRAITVRPHPLHIKEGAIAMRELEKRKIRCQFEDPRQLPINDSLAETAFHITYGSTCALDALNFGVSSLHILDVFSVIEDKYKTGLLLKKIGDSLPPPNPEKAIDYSLGTAKKVEHAVSVILKSPEQQLGSER